MTNPEFSDGMATLLNSYGSVAVFGEQASKEEIVLDEYEKSVLLTQAQDIIVRSYLERSMNAQAQGFDDSAQRQADFSSLMSVAELEEYPLPGAQKFDERGVFFHLPTTANDSDPAVLVITNEKLLLIGSSHEVKEEYVVKPISNSEYDREMSKAYGKPLKRQAWRLFQNPSTEFDILSEIIPRDELGSGESWVYRIRYVRRPCPIILEHLGNDLSIDGINEETSCELNPILHVDILHKAVELALISRGVRLNNKEQNNNNR